MPFKFRLDRYVGFIVGMQAEITGIFKKLLPTILKIKRAPSYCQLLRTPRFGEELLVPGLAPLQRRLEKS